MATSLHTLNTFLHSKKWSVFMNITSWKIIQTVRPPNRPCQTIDPFTVMLSLPPQMTQVSFSVVLIFPLGVHTRATLHRWLLPNYKPSNHQRWQQQQLHALTVHLKKDATAGLFSLRRRMYSYKSDTAVTLNVKGHGDHDWLWQKEPRCIITHLQEIF